MGAGACRRTRVLKADALVILRRKLEQYNSPRISLLPSLAWTQPLRSTLAVSWMKFSSLPPSDRPRFVLLLRELVWVSYFYCPRDDSSPNSLALVCTLNTHCHQNHNTAAKELPDVHMSALSTHNSTVQAAALSTELQYCAMCINLHFEKLCFDAIDATVLVHVYTILCKGRGHYR